MMDSRSYIPPKMLFVKLARLALRHDEEMTVGSTRLLKVEMVDFGLISKFL